MLRNRAKRKYGTVAQEIQFSEFYRTAIISNTYLAETSCLHSSCGKGPGNGCRTMCDKQESMTLTPSEPQALIHPTYATIAKQKCRSPKQDQPKWKNAEGNTLQISVRE